MSNQRNIKVIGIRNETPDIRLYVRALIEFAREQQAAELPRPKKKNNPPR